MIEERHIPKTKYPYPHLYMAVGEVVKLMMCSPAHRHYTMEHVDRLVLPALIKNKCQVFYNNEDGDMIGFISYTFLRSEREYMFLDRQGLIDWDDWATKPTDGNLWVMDVIAPFGGAKKMCRQTAKQVAEEFPGRRVFFRRSLQNDRISRVVLQNKRIIESEGVH